MRVQLSLHPATPCPAGSGVEVEVARRRGGVLDLRYRLTGDIAGISLPKSTASERADDLWRTTCFEAFVRADGDDGYCELNLSPSSQWAAYSFSGYREGMASAELPEIALACAASDQAVELSASINLSRALPPNAPWRLALATVVQNADQSIAYWALAHAPERPDFHHPESFVLELAEPA